MPAYLLGLPVAMALALILWERRAPASAAQRGEWMNNGTAFALTMFSLTFLAPLIAVSETGLVNGLGGGLVDLRPMAWPVGALIYLVAMDLGEYLFHRAQHALPWLWAMHSLHHSDRGMNFTTSQRHFWLDPAIKSVTIWLAVSLLFRADPLILTIYFVISVWHLVTHANIRLGFGAFSWVLNSPQYHRLHHSGDARHYNANFAALFPIFDVLSGSYRRPAPGEFPDTGLDDTVTRPLELVIWPARGLIRGPPAGALAEGQGAQPR
jgi:sterol desaturase/sphingolipid hydroxylase (fatty acid hydroxylase superfamily)